LDSGRLRVVLPQFELPSADLFVYYASRANQPVRTRAFIDFLVEHFQKPTK
jgi:DNA-binding transcriptional LysR family regulator